MASQLERIASEKSAKELALQSILLSSFAEATKERYLAIKSSEIIMKHLRSMDLDVAEAYVKVTKDLPKKFREEEEWVKKEGKVLPATTAIQQIPDN